MLDMDQKKTMGYSEADRGIDLAELSIVLVVKSNDPSIINPDFQGRRANIALYTDFQ